MNQLTKEDIKNLVTHFYQKIQQDEILGPIFNDVAKVDWDHHIPLLCEFWNSIMLKTNEYHSNAYMKHVILGQQVEIKEEHFARWLAIFHEQAYKYLPAKSAEMIVQRAELIASSLKLGCVKEYM